MRVFVAGATGAIGRQLVPLLIDHGHEVTGTTRHPDRASALARDGADAVVVDILHAEALADVIVAAHPDVVIHQVTGLADGFGPAELERNARLREVGTANLVAASVAAGAGQLVAQSIAWLYAGPPPWDEGSRLLTEAEAPDPVTLRGVLALERLVLGSAGIEGTVLRYGRLYGPGTSAPTDGPVAPGGRSSDGAIPLPPHPRVHVRTAARAAIAALERGAPGIYDIVDRGGPVSGAKARTDLGLD